MSESLNSAGAAHARSLIDSGAADRDSGWSFDAADGNALLGPKGDDWTRYGSAHLGVNSDAPDRTRGHYSYPFAKLKGGKLTVFRSALTAIRQRAGQQGSTAIYDAAGKLLASIDGKKAGQAAGEPSSLLGTATVDFQADAADGDPGQPRRPTFNIHGYTGAPMNIEGFYNPVIVDLNGLKAPTPTLPVLRQHDPNRIVGQASVNRIDESGVHLGGVVTGDNHDAKEVVDHAKNGFKWQASIGADIQRREFLENGKKAVVNGREITGPMVIVRGAQLKEVSFVPIGADGATSAAVAASSSSGRALKGAMSMFDTWLQAKGFDPAAITEEQSTFLRAMYDREHPAGGGGGGSAVHAGAGTTAAGVDSIDAIMAEQRLEATRVGEITALTRQFVAEYPHQADGIERLARNAIEAKMSSKDYELQLRRYVRPRVPGMIARPSFADGVNGGVLECAICQSLQLPGIEKEYKPETLDAAYRHFRHGIGLKELLRVCASFNGHPSVSDGDVRGLLQAAFGGPRSPELRAADGFSTVEISGILSNVMNKFVMIAFNNVENAWQRIAAVRPLRDFKTHYTYALTGNLQYEKVGNDGEIKHGDLSETSYNVTADIYAKMITLTRKDIINDDLGALQEVPRKLGRGAALKINDVFWTAFLANPTQSDSLAFWHASHNNLQTGSNSALAATGLTNASVAFNKQKDPNGFPLAVTPRILLVPPELEYTADQLMHSSLIVASQQNATPATVPDKNIWQNKFDPVMSRYLSNSSYTGFSTTAWYLLASPEDLPTVQIGFLNGRQTPIIESAEADFDVLGIKIRGYHDFGCAMMEYRASVKSAGA